MLTFVFWHAPGDGVDPDEYAKRLIAFHEALASEPSDGFLFSEVYRQPPVPWLPDAPTVYEDRYRVANSAALDPLDEAAVRAGRKTAHDRVAALAGPGAGGLYRLCAGAVGRGSARTALWFDKPRGLPRTEWLRGLEPVVKANDGELWSRQMVLGPAPEWCLRVAVDQAPAVNAVLHEAALTPVYPRAPRRAGDAR